MCAINILYYVQEYYGNLSYTKVKKTVSAEEVYIFLHVYCIYNTAHLMTVSTIQHNTAHLMTVSTIQHTS